jgi:hypothetical protein
MPSRTEQLSGGTDLYVHVPKAAGTSLYGALVETHGPKNVYTYDDRSDRIYRADRRLIRREDTRFLAVEGLIKAVPASIIRAGMKGWELRSTSKATAMQRAEAIIGHFPVEQFDDVPGAERARLITVVREPLGRMVSHFRFLQQQRGYDPGLRGWMRGHDADLPFGQFALSELVHNFQTRYTGTDPGRYAVIGTVENFDGFLDTMGLSHAGEGAPRLNVTRAVEADTSLARDPGFVREFQTYHAADYEFYQAALDRPPSTVAS